MKTIVTVSLLFILCSSRAAIRTAVGNSGQGWSVASNWSPAIIPHDGDTVYIPTGITISVKTNIYNSTPNLVIRIFGTLTFSSGGKLDLGTNSQLIVYTGGFITTAGTPSEVIKIGDETKYKGNTDGTIVGPAYSDINSGLSPAGFYLSILPVKFQSFTARTTNQKQASFNWIVNDESQIEFYTLEKSIDNRSWKTVRMQKAGNSQQPVNTYYESDSFLTAGISYYRVKAEGYTGDLYYSKIEKIEDHSTKAFTIYPNPVSSRLRLQIDPTQLKGGVTVTLLN